MPGNPRLGTVFAKNACREGWPNPTFPSLVAAALVFLIVPGQSQAQQTDADFNTYCRVTYSNSTYQKIPQSWGTEHACVQGGTRQGIDLGEACYLTTGSRQFEISGARVLCSGTPDTAPDPTANDLGEPDFARYCREEFAGSTYEKRAEPQGAAHYCRRPGSTGGFTLQPVSLASACRAAWGSAAYRAEGDRVFCVMESSSVETMPGVVIPGEPGRPANPDAPPDFPNIPPINPPFPGPSFPGPVPSGPAAEATPPPDGRDDAIVERACTATPVGAWTSGTLPMVQEIQRNMERELGKPCDGPAELCQGYYGGVATQHYFETLMIFQCHQSFIKYSEESAIGDFALAIDEACTIEPILNEMIQRAQSFGFPMPAQHYLIINETEFHEICDCKTEPTDFKALAEELMRQADKDLLEEFLQ
ncbi:hypothetical protein [Marimonas arenosa]|uniref:Uncharacterized protein n=1 Tax=Marimonas arenosa TaxID=1795305 RepID=A0AAE3WEP8_9RHOB|nr:hypothetical protein [Marimonas arenosa]MDQ2091646.1 hypothetical protein [Marimonas arenosa]